MNTRLLNIYCKKQISRHAMISLLNFLVFIFVWQGATYASEDSVSKDLFNIILENEGKSTRDAIVYAKEKLMENEKNDVIINYIAEKYLELYIDSINEDDLVSALEYAQKSANLVPKSIGNLVTLGKIYKIMNKENKLEEALGRIREIEDGEIFANYLEHDYEAYPSNKDKLTIKKIEENINSLEMPNNDNKDSKFLLNIGEQHYKLSKYKNKTKNLNQALMYLNMISNKEDSMECMMLMMNIYSDLDNYEKSKEISEKIKKLIEDDTKSTIDGINEWRKTREVSASNNDLNKEIGIPENDIDDGMQDIRGMITEKLSELENDINNPEIYYEISELYWKLNRSGRDLEHTQKAIDSLKAAIKIDEKEKYYTFLVGIYEGQMEYDKCIEWLEKALENNDYKSLSEVLEVYQERKRMMEQRMPTPN